MIDTLLNRLPTARTRVPGLRRKLGLEGDFALLTLHRPSNVDELSRLEVLLAAVGKIGDECSVVFPVHPRTRAQLADVQIPPTIHVVDPLGYLDFVGLQASARLVLSDSGGIQEETSVLGVPCLTLRDTTERPITVMLGTNQVVGTDPDEVLSAARSALARSWAPAKIPLWDGQAGERIADVMLADLA
jgi:UDP-N-acetylglucosamine 2-epimerase (non-hydrolysing)